MPDPLDPRAWNRFGYVYGNPANYTDPSGHCIDGISTAVCAVVGAAVVAGTLNVGIGAGAAYISGEEYTLGTAGIDFTVGAAFGALGFGVGARFASPLARITSYGILGVGEGITGAYWRGDEFTTNNMAWAFVGGVGFGTAGELAGVFVRSSAQKGWGLAQSEHVKAMESIGNHNHSKWMRSFHIRTAMKQARVYGLTHTIKYHLKAASRYPIRPIYKANPKNLSAFAQTTIWAAGTLSGDSEHMALYSSYLPDIVPNSRTLIQGQ